MKLRNVWLALGGAWVATIFYLSLIPHPPEPLSFAGADKVEHALAYGLLMLWFCQLQFRRVQFAVGFVAMGVTLEFLQGMSGYRYFEYADMLANATGVLIGWGLAHTRLGQVLNMLKTDGKR